MRLKVDENLHDDVAVLMTAKGHDVHTVHSEGLRGCGPNYVRLERNCTAMGGNLTFLER
jgi:hypothetical protein